MESRAANLREAERLVFETEERMLALTLMASLRKAMVASGFFPLEHYLVQVLCFYFHVLSEFN